MGKKLWQTLKEYRLPTFKRVCGHFLTGCATVNMAWVVTHPHASTGKVNMMLVCIGALFITAQMLYRQVDSK